MAAWVVALAALACGAEPTTTTNPAPCTALPADVSPARVRPGAALKIGYVWDAVPTGTDCSVFVHLIDKTGRIALQDDHLPPWPTATSTWAGRNTYARRVRIPADLPPGDYRIGLGLYDKAGRRPLLAGPGTEALGVDEAIVGRFSVDPAAPPPPLDSDKPATLSLDGYRLTFADEFDGGPDVSAAGPGTKWTAHTPYGGDFGEAAFTDPTKDFPFTSHDGVLNITAKRIAGRWRSGLLCSVDPKGRGFSQTYGYFEMRAKFPAGPGTWPAFWLLNLKSLTEKADACEIDVVEQYGLAPQIAHGTFHWWPKNQPHHSVSDSFYLPRLDADFHRYGLLWDERQVRWFFDGVEVWQIPTPAEAHQPMYVLADLALGGGWPIDATPDPSVMAIDYVRVYEKKPP